MISINSKGFSVEIIFYLAIMVIIFIVGYSILIQFFSTSPLEKSVKNLKDTIEMVCTTAIDESSVNIFIPSQKTITLGKDGVLYANGISKKINCTEKISFEHVDIKCPSESVTVNVTKIPLGSRYRIIIKYSCD